MVVCPFRSKHQKRDFTQSSPTAINRCRYESHSLLFDQAGGPCTERFFKALLTTSLGRGPSDGRELHWDSQIYAENEGAEPLGGLALL